MASLPKLLKQLLPKIAKKSVSSQRQPHSEAPSADQDPQLDHLLELLQILAEQLHAPELPKAKKELDKEEGWLDWGLRKASELGPMLLEALPAVLALL